MLSRKFSPNTVDFDVDGKADVAVYRSELGNWWIKPSSGDAPYAAGWGKDPTDKPVPGIMTAMEKMDIAIYRPGNGAWYVIPSRGGFPYDVGWGGDASDIPLSANITLTN